MGRSVAEGPGRILGETLADMARQSDVMADSASSNRAPSVPSLPDAVAEEMRRADSLNRIAVAIRDLNRAMDWDLPDDQAVTVAGLVIHEAQTIPKIGQTFIFHRHRFQVVKRVRNQITALRISPPLETPPEA